MKKISFTYTLIVVFSTLLVLSCKMSEIDLNTDQENIESQRSIYAKNIQDNSIKGDYKLEAGVLHFKDLDAYLKVKNSFSGKSIQERLLFAQMIGFESQLVLVENALEDINSSKNKDEFSLKIEKYKDLINYDGEIVSSRISDGCASALLNRNGIVVIGKIPYRFADGIQYVAFNGDINLLNVVTKASKTVVSAELGVFDMSLNLTNRAARQCQNLGGELTISDRRGSMITGSDITYYWNGSSYTVQGHSRTDATAYKKNFWGWSSYSTSNTLFVGYIYVLYLNNFQNTVLKSELINYNYSNNYDHIDYDAYTYAYNVSTSNYQTVRYYINDETSGILPPPNATPVTKYTNQGLGGSWLIPTCM